MALNTAVQVAGKGAVLLMGAVSIAVLTRYLGPEDYGRYTLALMYMQLFGVLADVGLFTTVVRDISKEPGRTEELVGNAMTLRSLLALVAIVLGAAVSLALPYDRDVRLAILLAGGPLALGLLNTSIVAVFQSRLRMDRAVISETIGRAATLALTIAVAALDLGFFAVFGAAAGGTLVSLLLSWRLSRGFARIRFLADPPLWGRMLRASLPLGLALALNELYFRADTVIISLFRDYAEVGAYTLAYRILEFTLAIGTVFLASMLPVLSGYVARGDQRVNTTIQESWDLFLILGLPLAAGGAIAAPAVIELAAGEGFGEATDPLRILLAAGALSWLNGVFGYALIAKDRQASALWLNALGLTVNVGLNLALVPEYGIVAAAVVTVGSELVILTGSYFLMRRHFNFFPRARVLPAVALAAALMCAALWPLRDGSLLVLLPLALLVYAGALYLLSPTSRAILAHVTRRA